MTNYELKKKLNVRKNPLVLLEKMNDYLTDAQTSNEKISLGLLLDFLKNASSQYSVKEEDEVEINYNQ